MQKVTEYDTSFRKNREDYILSIAALLQPVLILLQLFMLDALQVDPAQANKFRIIATALPILWGMVIVFKRNYSLAIISYVIVLIVLGMTLLRFPGRWEYMREDVLKFTLPVIIPIGLCIASVRNFSVLMKCLVYVSIFAVIIGLLYAIMYLSGAFVIETYSMTFSYALLFPTCVLLNKKGWIWKLIAICLMLEMLAIGSRGALLLSGVYWLFVLLWKAKGYVRALILVVAVVLAFLFTSPVFLGFLNSSFRSVGIHSRTIQLMMDNELISHDSGRDDITETTWELIGRSPLFGSGVWADREYSGRYCHNVVLEFLLDFGYVGTFFFMIWFVFVQARTFLRLPKNHKGIFIMVFFPLVSLLVSSSYLISFNVGLFLGFSYLQSRQNKLGRYQDYVYT